MGDSQLVIHWLKNIRPLKNIHIRPIYEETLILVVAFRKITFKHIYLVRNTEADKISKQGLLLDIKTWDKWYQIGDKIEELDLGPILGM